MFDTIGIIMRSINSKSLQKLVLIHLGNSDVQKENKTKYCKRNFKKKYMLQFVSLHIFKTKHTYCNSLTNS